MKMERLYKFTYSLLVAAFLSIPFNSCIKEDMDDCPSNIRVYFDYLPATYTVIKRGIDPTEVSQMNLYWFDANTNVFLGSKIDEAPTFGTDYYMDIPALKTGEYKFIAWGNLKGCYSLLPENPEVGVTTYDKFATSLNTIEEDSVKNTIAPLFYGQCAMKEIKAGDFTPEIRIPIVKNTYTINLKVDGALDANSRYKFVISDNNTYFDFDNSYIPSARVHYVTYCGFPENGLLSGSITTLRIGEGRAPILKVVDTKAEANPVFSADLIEMLLKIEEDYKIDIDFSQMYEFDIEITINGNSFIVVINGWKLTYKEDELHG